MELPQSVCNVNCLFNYVKAVRLSRRCCKDFKLRQHFFGLHAKTAHRPLFSPHLTNVKAWSYTIRLFSNRRWRATKGYPPLWRFHYHRQVLAQNSRTVLKEHSLTPPFSESEAVWICNRLLHQNDRAEMKLWFKSVRLTWLEFLWTDWVKDAVHERQRKSALKSMNKNSDSWRSWWALTFESAQTWIVISLVGKYINRPICHIPA